MKTTGLFLGLGLGILSVASAAEHLWENFDEFPLGSIAAQPGWTHAAWLATQTGQVSAAGSYSDSHCLELPWHASGSSAVYTNFASTYVPGLEHPVIRFSAKLHTPNSNTFFQFGLRNSSAGHFLSFQSSNGYGVVGFQYRDTVFVPLVTNHFADATVYYNRSNGQIRLDYDLTNRLAWVNADIAPTVHAQFNQFVVSRLANTAQTTGYLLVDDVSVQTFPPHVWAWWRCTSLPGARFVEQLGTFPPAWRAGYGDTHRSGASDPVWDGTADFHNAGATRLLAADSTNCALAIPGSSNWTLEVVFRVYPEETQPVSFLDWSRGLGFNTNVAWISFGYKPATNAFYFSLRDAEQADGEYIFSSVFGTLVPDGRWHHATLVKSNADLRLYLDYQSAIHLDLATAANGTRADGTYSFNTLSQAAIGRTLGNGNNCGPDTVIDEVRISGKALALSEFLQPGQPLLVDIRGNAMNNDPWPLTMKGISGKSYQLETSPALGPAANWQPVPGSTFTAATTFTLFDVPSTLPRTNFVRLRRQD